MRGGADQFDAARVRLIIGLGPPEAGKERVMDLMQSPPSVRRRARLREIDVAREDDDLSLGVAHDLPNRVSCSILVCLVTGG